MADDKTTLPKICASLSLDPTTHSFSNSQAPTINLTLTLHHNGPITIYADDLSPQSMLRHGAFSIHNATTGAEIKQSLSTRCRFEPPSKVQVELNEDLFHTLQPSVPLTFSRPFTRFSRDDAKPRAASDPEYSGGRTCGVDGLWPDARYILTLSKNSRIHWQYVRWWEYGTKEEVLSAGNLDPRKVKSKPGPHEALRIDATQIEPITFQCVR